MPDPFELLGVVASVAAVGLSLGCGDETTLDASGGPCDDWCARRGEQCELLDPDHIGICIDPCEASYEACPEETRVFYDCAATLTGEAACRVMGCQREFALLTDCLPWL